MNRFTLSRRAALLATLSLLSPLLAGCPPPPTDNGNTASTTTGGTTGGAREASPASAGTAINIKGSETLLPLSQAWVDAFKKENPDANINLAGGGSGQGINALIGGNADIANSSRDIEDKETKQAEAKGIKVTEYPVAMDGVTVIVNPKNPVKSLTMAQLSDIYTGKVKNWKEVGGADQKIIASGRDSSSGTYKDFQKDVLKGADYRADMLSATANPQIATNVSQSAGGIGYLGVAFTGEYIRANKVKEVALSPAAGQPAVLPTQENVHAGKYPISRSLYCYVAGEPTGTAKAYLDFVTSEKGQEIVKKMEYITLKK